MAKNAIWQENFTRHFRSSDYTGMIKDVTEGHRWERKLLLTSGREGPRAVKLDSDSGPVEDSTSPIEGCSEGDKSGVNEEKFRGGRRFLPVRAINITSDSAYGGVGAGCILRAIRRRLCRISCRTSEKCCISLCISPAPE